MNRRNPPLIISLIVLISIMCILAVILKDSSNKPVDNTFHKSPTAISSATLHISSTPEITPVPYTDISIISSGDIMYHGPQINSAKNPVTGIYDFNDNMKYIKEVISSADYAVGNLETTLAGDQNGNKYSGHPNFNAPDSVLDSLKNAGFDMLLLSNNHSYDTGRFGLDRTFKKVREKGLDSIGTRDSETKSYFVKEINGIKIGFLNYGYESSDVKEENCIRINGHFVKKEDAEFIDTFNYSYKNEFYEEVNTRIHEMRIYGADLIILYIHWGSEYNLKENNNQKEIAQNLCNIGVDAIIGSHPHVIQRAEIIYSQVSDNKTLCFYSLGNFISNQNRLTLKNPSVPLSEYTENGVLVKLNIRKYANGDTYILSTDYTPTWVHRIDKGNSIFLYQIVPLPYAIEHPDSYGLRQTAFGIIHSKTTLERTDLALQTVINEYNDLMENIEDAA